MDGLRRFAWKTYVKYVLPVAATAAAVALFVYPPATRSQGGFWQCSLSQCTGYTGQQISYYCANDDDGGGYACCNYPGVADSHAQCGLDGFSFYYIDTYTHMQYDDTYTCC